MVARLEQFHFEIARRTHGGHPRSVSFSFANLYFSVYRPATQTAEGLLAKQQ
jgi:hypothetical protein